MHPNDIKNYIRRIIVLLIGMVFMSIGGSTLVVTQMGADPILVFEQGVATFFAMDLGTAILIINAVLCVVIFFIDKRKINIGTIIVTILIGPLINLVISLGFIPTPDAFWIRVLMVFIAIIVGGFGIALYIFAGIGVAPFEGFVLIIQERSRIRLAFVKIANDAVLFIIGWLLGGVIGIGSVLTVIFFGPLLDFYLCQLKRTNILKPFEPREEK